MRESYTIGGMMIFPKRPRGFNQSRGCNKFILDRWDLSLEHIRGYYKGDENPLYETIKEDKDVFSLFVDFRYPIDCFSFGIVFRKITLLRRRW